MKIASIEAIPIRYPEPNDFNSLRQTTLVKITTNEGIVGWGESIAMWPEAVLAVKTLIDNGLSELLLGENPLNTEVLWQKMKDYTWWYGEGGIASFAIAGIDIALWDIKGKVLGVPLYQLFGGKHWDRLPACASTHPSKTTHEENAEELASYIRQGYQSVKVGFGKKGHANLGRDSENDIVFVRTVRRTIGNKAGLMVDIGNGVKWNISQAITVTRAFEEYGIDWIEEPFHPNNLPAHAELKVATTTLIAAGEREWNIYGYERMIRSGAVDVIGIDPARAEGITAFLKVIELVGLNHCKFNAHAWSTSITTAASIHLSISSPHCMLMEMKPVQSPVQYELVTDPIEQKDGWIYPIEKPGLGIEINEEAVEHFRFS